MDGFVSVPVDVREAFARLVEPRHLRSWLPALERVQPEPGVVGVPFEVLLQNGGSVTTGHGELVVCEPPHVAVWRFHTVEDMSVVRLTCSRDGSATRVHIHQDGASRHQLDIDLDRLRALLSEHPEHPTEEESS